MKTTVSDRKGVTIKGLVSPKKQQPGKEKKHPPRSKKVTFGLTDDGVLKSPSSYVSL